MDFIQHVLKVDVILTPLVEMLIYWILFSGFFEKKENSWKNVLKVAILPVSIITISYFAPSATIKMLLLFVIGCIICFITFQASIKSIVIYHCIWMLCSVVGDTLATGIIFASNSNVDITGLLGNHTMYMQAVILSKTINLVIVTLLVKKLGKVSNRYTLAEMFILILQGVSGIASLMLVFEFTYFKISTYEVTSVFLIFLSVVIFTAYVIFYIMFENYIQKKNIEKEVLKVQFYNQGQYEYFSSMEEENLNIRKMYHDIKNHLLAIKGLNSENQELAEAYIQDCLDAVEGFNHFQDTGNKLADIILYEKCNAARMNNIHTKVMIQKDSLNHIDMLDLCAILTNSLDNAIEACKHCVGERQIHVKSIKNEASLILTFKNNYEAEPIKNEKGNFVTRKKNKAEHGVGMQSIKMAAQKYNGNVEISVDQNTKEFLLIIMIPNAA